MQVGDERGGFAITRDSGGPVLTVRAWGFWSPETANAFDGAVLGECPARVSFLVAIDASGLTAQRDEARDAFSRLFRSLRLRGGRVEITTASPLTKLQLSRVIKEHELGATVTLK